MIEWCEWGELVSEWLRNETYVTILGCADSTCTAVCVVILTPNVGRIMTEQYD